MLVHKADGGRDAIRSGGPHRVPIHRPDDRRCRRPADTGVVIALLLLLSALTMRGWWLGPGRAVPDVLSRMAKALHDHFGLLFVPAGVGIVDNFGRLTAQVPALLAAVLLSTIATIAVTALVAARRPSRVPLGDAAAAE